MKENSLKFAGSVDIKRLLAKEVEFIQYLTASDMGGTADKVQTLYGEIRRLRKIEDAALQIEECLEYDETVPHLWNVLKKNPRPVPPSSDKRT